MNKEVKNLLTTHAINILNEDLAEFKKCELTGEWSDCFLVELFNYSTKKVIGKYYINTADIYHVINGYDIAVSDILKEVKNPCFIIGDDVIYFESDEDDKHIVYGTICNCGLIPQGCFEYDFDFSLDSNLQALYEQIIDERLKKGLSIE